MEQSRFKTLQEWRRAQPWAYHRAFADGLIREVCDRHGWEHPKTRKSTKPRKRSALQRPQLPFGYWTKERCIESAKSYTVRSKWQRENYAAYDAARKNGWLDECCYHIPYINRNSSFYTLENCQASARKYTTKMEWANSEDRKFHKAAYTRGWLEQCCAHMAVVQLPHGYWTKERCKTIARQYKTRWEWVRESPSSYHTASRKGWRDECTLHMEEFRKPNGYWNKERCMEIARQFNTLGEWQKNHGTSCGIARNKGWVDECSAHMIKNRKSPGHWTLETCLQSAIRFQTKKEWKTGDGHAYAAAGKLGYMDLCCKHMSKTPRMVKFTKEVCLAAAKKYNIRQDWRESVDAGTYRAANNNGWLEECCAHMTVVFTPSGWWTLERCLEISRQYTTRGEWQKTHSTSYQAARKHGFLNECTAHMTRVKQPNGYYTKMVCLESARLYSCKRDWSVGNISAYGIARRRGWLEECCAHMVSSIQLKWTKEQCMSIARKYSIKNEWRQGVDSASFRAARNHGWLDECCRHMKPKHQ